MKRVNALRGRFNQLSTIAVLVVVFAAGFALGNQYAVSEAQSGMTSPPPEAQESFSAFWQVYNMIQDDYLETVSPETLVDGAIEGMIGALGDPFSGYMDPTIYPILNENLDGELQGIGVVIQTLEETGEIEVVNVLEGAPAEAEGVMPGDIFVTVDGADVDEFDQTELAMRVRGPIGTEVEITMRRDEELIDFVITRDRITIPNTTVELLDDEIGYVRLNQFNPEARNQIEDALDELTAETSDAQLDALVIDLRGNPGGLLTSVIDVTSAFLDDEVILIEQFASGREQVFNTNGRYLGLEIPMVVLVDGTSASASELLAGALQDTGRATIVGETTFGKGTVQTWQGLVNGGGIRLTIARWLTPNRNWIHEQGVTPDIIIELDEEMIEQMIESEGEFDPQLDAAIDHLQAQVNAQ